MRLWLGLKESLLVLEIQTEILTDKIMCCLEFA